MVSKIFLKSFFFQEELEAEKQKWSNPTENFLNSEKSNPREAEEPPVQSEPVDLSRRSDQSHFQKTLFSSTLEDSRNNNGDIKYLSCDVEGNGKSNLLKNGSLQGINSCKTVVPLDISSFVGNCQEQKSPTTKNPVPKSPWQSNSRLGSLVKSKAILNDPEVEKKDNNENFGKIQQLVLQVPKYNPQLINHQTACESSKNFLLFFFKL